jgi:hypothetical protein
MKPSATDAGEVPRHSPRLGSGRATRIARLRLAAIWSGIVVVWVVMLPWIAARPRVAARLHELDAEGIDPSAMFYSELPAMEGVLQKLDRSRRNDPHALWSFP